MSSTTITQDAIGFGVAVKQEGEHVAGDYNATLTDFKNVGPSKFNPEKNQIEMTFQLPDGSQTRMWVNQAFGYSKLAGWAKLAQVIHALTGILPGDKAQLSLKKSDLVGKSMRVTTETNDKGYARIVDFGIADSTAFEDDKAPF